MKIKIKINGKMLVFVLGTTIFVFIMAMGYVAITLRNISKENSQIIIQAKSTELANQVEQKLNSYINAAQLLEEVFLNYDKIQEVNRRSELSKFMEDLLKDNKDFSAIWAICELNSIDNFDEQYINQPGSTASGNFSYSYFYKNDQITFNSADNQYPLDTYNKKLYYQIKNNPEFSIAEPFFTSIGDETDTILQTSFALPIIKNNRFIGVVGINAPLSSLQKTFSQLNPMGEGRIYILSHNGNFVTHPDSKFLGHPFAEYAPELVKKFNLSEVVTDGKNVSFMADEPQTANKSLYSFKPLAAVNSNTSWAFCLSIPMAVINQATNNTFVFDIFTGLMGLIILSLIIFGIASSITKPLRKATQQLQLIAKGDIENIDSTSSSLVKDEITDMSEAMNRLTDGLKAATHFAQEIGKGKLDVNYKMLSEHDILGTSLVTMQESLVAAHKEGEKKKIEDEKRNWVTHGLASFGEIIRQHNDDMGKFTLNVTKNLIKYLNASQGAMYINQQIETDANQVAEFELMAAIAYGKQVMLKKTIVSGQELLGRAVEENKTIYLEDLPEKYVLLSPGMKQDTRPRNLLIIPITINDVPMGIFELLSYSHFEPHHIEFIEKLSENIASVILSVKTNERTSKLLEQSQDQADILAQHEEEMRQNLEEMQATQEESAKREDSLKSFILAIKSNIMTAELDMDGKIFDMSNVMCNVYGVNIENMKGKFFDAIVAQDSDSRKEFGEFWTKMIHNGSGKRKQYINQRNKEAWIVESYKVIQRDRMAPIVLLIAIDRTKEKEMDDMLAAEIRNMK